VNTYHYIALSMFALLALLDHFGRGHRLAAVPHWRLLGTIAMLSYFAILTYAPLLWDGRPVAAVAASGGRLPDL
jgi:hypothetical protein